ncbi:hypothetical protein [Ilumatobacter sp.]|uniref:hypothetical protein n=1 Tax=Ilumatobacter sp. TaxID=1967498 RepID=UPI003B51CDF8
MNDIDLDALVSTTAANGFGITDAGFVPKSVGRLLDEKLSAAQVLFGSDLDLTSGSVTRKWLEMLALEEARLWEHLGSYYADSFISTATGDALSMLGSELGIERPHHRSVGSVTISLDGDLPSGIPTVRLERGTRLLTTGGHDFFLSDAVELTADVTSAAAAVMAFEPGPEFNLDPSDVDQILVSFNELDHRSDVVRQIVTALAADVVVIEHDQPMTGGEDYWSDSAYRDLLLTMPRNLWTPEAIKVAVSLVAGVRQTVVKDLFGGLDINQSIYGNFNFVERLFSEERSLGEPYYFTVLVAPGDGAIWDGPGQLLARIRDAVDEVRPIGILPKIEMATLVGAGFSCDLTVDGIPIPGGTASAINSSPEARAVKFRILQRVRRYVALLLYPWVRFGLGGRVGGCQARAGRGR